MKPNISVIITITDNDKINVNLDRLLHSIYEQTMHNVEIIFIVSKMINVLYDIVEQYNAERKIISIFESAPDKSSFQMKHQGVEISNGDYILFADINSYFETRSFEKLYEKAETNHADIVHFRSRVLHGFVESKNKVLNNKKICVCRETLTGHEILNMCYAEKKISTHIEDKLYNAAIIHEAFNLIPNSLYDYCENDILFFFIIFLSNKYIKWIYFIFQ